MQIALGRAVSDLHSVVTSLAVPDTVRKTTVIFVMKAHHLQHLSRVGGAVGTTIGRDPQALVQYIDRVDEMAAFGPR